MSTPSVPHGPGSSLEGGPLGTPVRIVALSVLSVPLLHLYLRVPLSPLELLIHTLDIGLATALACVFSRVAIRMLGRNAALQARARRMLPIGTAVLSLSLFLFAFQGLLPGSDAILERHVDAGYGDMGLRVVPLAALLAYLVWGAERRARLRREVFRLRSVNARSALPQSPAPSEHEAPLALAHTRGVLLASPQDVMRVEAMENYCEFVLRPEAGAAPVPSVPRIRGTSSGSKLL